MKTEIKEIPLITVKVINSNIVEQLYPTRGELDITPYPNNEVSDPWVAVGKLSTCGDIILRNMSNGEIRLCFAYRYCRSKQNIADHAKFIEFMKTVHDSLPTIYVD